MITKEMLVSTLFLPSFFSDPWTNSLTFFPAQFTQQTNSNGCPTLAKQNNK